MYEIPIYLIINILVIIVPLMRSFERKIAFYKKFKALFTSIFLTGFFFVFWDIVFTKLGIWSFNEQYLIGLNLAGLPVEEWLFFITIPFACVFIYEVANYFIYANQYEKFCRGLAVTLAIFLLIIALMFPFKLYTSFTFGMTGLFLLFLAFVARVQYFAKFFLAYFIHLFPFLLVNGILTSIPIVMYNDDFNTGIKIFSIPVEDSIYSMLLLLMNISIFELLKKKDSALSGIPGDVETVNLK